MGVSSARLFGDDTACDVRDAYADLLRSGMNGRQATKQMLDDWSEEIDDADDGPIFWLALAATQWKYGRLEPRVKSKALGIIAKGTDLERWEDEGDPKLVKERRRALEQLRAQLESPQPAAKPVRVQKPPEPLKKIVPLWKPGQVVVYRLDSGDLVLFLTEGAQKDQYHGHVPYFVLLDWQGKELPSPDEIQQLPFTRVVMAVWPYRKQPPPLDRIQRLDLFRELTGLLYVGRSSVGGPRTDTNWKELQTYLVSVLRKLKAARTRKKA